VESAMPIDLMALLQIKCAMIPDVDNLFIRLACMR